MGPAPDFQAVQADIAAMVQARWPDAALERILSDSSLDMEAWMVPVPDAPAEEDWNGTMPRDRLVIAPTQKKAGITIHVWHPKHPYLLKENADWLQDAGFRPMVGCLQWNRKADVPLDALERLLDLCDAAM